MQKQKFHHNWTYEEGSGGVLSAFFGPKKEPLKITLPHDASILKPRDKEEATGSGNGFFLETSCHYDKSFMLEEKDKEKVVWFEFEGIYQNAFIYINNAFAGKCPYGYSNFYIDATKFVKFGEQNQIQVIVKNGVPSGRWYTGQGIYRDVNLMIADRLHFIPDGIHITTADVEKDFAKLVIESTIEYNGVGMREVNLVFEVLEEHGTVIGRNEMPITIFEHSKETFRQTCIVENPKLWDLDTPYLYTYKASIQTKDEITDIETGTFGIRKLQLDKKHGLRLNGKTVKMRGGCIHHDNGIIGTAVFSHAEYNRIKKLKEAGYNAIRSSHYPMNRKLLKACDQIGMLVMDELTDVWTTTKVDFDYGMYFSEWWERDVTNMVNKDYNHPCVVLYSIGNEIPQVGNKIDNAWGKKLADKIRSLDNSRYVTNSVNFMFSVMDQLGSNQEINSTMNNMRDTMEQLAASDFTSEATKEAFAQVDIAGYNYATSRYVPDGERYPNRIIVGSETFPSDLDRNWELVMKLPYLIGDFSWTAWDYLGEAGIGQWNYNQTAGLESAYTNYPWRAAYCGDFNLIGIRRPVSYWREIIWGFRKEPYIAVNPPSHYGEKLSLSMWGFSDAIHSWNWSGYEKKPISLEVYADVEEVEVLVNGVSIERKLVGEEKRAITKFDTIYQPGKIEAIAYQDGKEVGRNEIVTADAQVEIEAVADKTELEAGGLDICYVEIALKDAAGNLNQDLNKPVSIKVEGAGILQGFGSANPAIEENYFDTTAVTFEGRLLAAIRSKDKPGDILVTICAEGCKDVIVKLQTK